MSDKTVLIFCAVLASLSLTFLASAVYDMANLCAYQEGKLLSAVAVGLFVGWMIDQRRKKHGD